MAEVVARGDDHQQVVDNGGAHKEEANRQCNVTHNEIRATPAITNNVPVHRKAPTLSFRK